MTVIIYFYIFSHKLHVNWMSLFQVLFLPEDGDLSPKHVRNVRCMIYDCINIVSIVGVCGCLQIQWREQTTSHKIHGYCRLYVVPLSRGVNCTCNYFNIR